MIRAVRRLLVSLLVVGACLAGLDALARLVAQDQAASRLEPYLGTKPTVRTHGWPFLAVLATQRLDGVEVSLPQARMELAGKLVTVDRIWVRADDVSGVFTPRSARLGALRGKASFGYQQFSRLVGVRMSPAGDGRVTFRSSSLPGVAQDVAVTGGAAAADGRLVITDPVASVGGQRVGEAQARTYADLVCQVVALPNQARVKVTSLEADESAVRLGVSGANLSVVSLR